MKKIFTILLLAATVITMLTEQALAEKHSRHSRKQKVEMAIETRSGTIYDYILIGMRPDASAALDNAYDTVTPGLGAGDQQLPYIQMVVPHPEWTTVKTDFRTDFRAIERSETWETTVTSNLAEGTLLTMSIDREQSSIPAGYSIQVEDMTTGIVQDLEQTAYVFPVKTSGISRQFRITIRKDRTHDRDD